MYGKYSKLYAEWCECYDPNKIELSVIEKYFEVENKDILDIGCGTGRFIFRILPMVKSVIGIDNDAESLNILNQLLKKGYNRYFSKVTLFCENVEEFVMEKKIIDLAIFSWSFYALNKQQMIHSLANIYTMLRDNGKLIILQPVGGEFEETMRMFFEEHVDMDEYNVALELMNEVTAQSYLQIATDKVVSEFVVKDLKMLCDALKMFAITEGESHKDALLQITLDKVHSKLKKFKQNDGYHLSDEVDVFVYEKRGLEK